MSLAEQQATADKHMGLCAELMLLQAAGQRKFLLEQPSSASSWQLPVIQDVTRRVPDVFLISFPQRRFGLRDPQGRPLITKENEVPDQHEVHSAPLCRGPMHLQYARRGAWAHRGHN